MTGGGLRIFMTADAVGGVWQYATDLSAELAKHGHEVALAVLGPPPTDGQRRAAQAIAGLQLIETGLPLDWLSSEPAAVRRAAEEMAALARRHGAQVLHCNHPALAGEAVFSAPILAVAHGCIATWWRETRASPLPPAFRWHRDLMREGLTRADAIAAPSKSFSLTVRQTYQLDRLPLTIHNGRRLPFSGHASDHRLNAAVTVGRLWDEAKNTMLLDRVAGAIRLPFLAAGPLRGPQGQEVSPCHLRPLGQLGSSELAELLALQPIFVSGARFEPFGLAVLEAAAAGCPLILSDIPTFRELWDGAAIFAHPDDAGAFSAAIDALAQAPRRRQELGMAAASRAVRYTPTATALAVEDVYARLLARREVAA